MACNNVFLPLLLRVDARLTETGDACVGKPTGSVS